MDHHQQVDLVLLDFRKAFDTVPYCRLLSKLHLTGFITRPTPSWIASWLTMRKQLVAIDGITLAWPDPLRTGAYRLEIISAALRGSGILH